MSATQEKCHISIEIKATNAVMHAATATECEFAVGGIEAISNPFFKYLYGKIRVGNNRPMRSERVGFVSDAAYLFRIYSCRPFLVAHFYDATDSALEAFRKYMDNLNVGCGVEGVKPIIGGLQSRPDDKSMADIYVYESPSVMTVHNNQPVVKTGVFSPPEPIRIHVPVKHSIAG